MQSAHQKQCVLVAQAIEDAVSSLRAESMLLQIASTDECHASEMMGARQSLKLAGDLAKKLASMFDCNTYL